MSNGEELLGNWYSRLCKKTEKMFSAKYIEKFREKYNAKASPEMKKAIKFTGLNIEPYHAFLSGNVMGMISATILIIVFLFLIVFATLGLIPSALIIILIFAIIICLLIVPLSLMIYFVNYPKNYAERVKISAIGRMPEAINYLCMAMRLSPSLDRATQFVSENIEEPLSTAMKKILWDVYMRKFDSIEDAFLNFAYEWGEWNEDFKRALYVIRGATLEKTEEGLQRSLEKASDIIVVGTKTKIESFVVSLSGPTMVLFSLGILLPMILGAMLPMVSMGGFNIDIWGIALLMNVLFPLITLIYANHILARRPGTTSPPHIPNTQSKLEKQTIHITTIAIFVGCTIFGIMTTMWNNPIGSLPIVWGIGFSIGYYCIMTTREQKKKREYYKKMESEFPDALFQVGSRIAEGNPIETALEKTSETMKGTNISEAFQKIAYLIRVTRKTLSFALFGRDGVLKNFPSRTITTTMRTVTETTKKDAISAGQTIVNISTYLRDMKKVDNDIKNQLGQVMSVMMSTAMFFAPIIMGITTALYKMMADVIENINIENVPMMPFKIGKASVVDPNQFLLVIGIYLILTVIIIMYFCAGIAHGEDNVERKFLIGSAMPIATIIFTVAVLMGKVIAGG